MQRKTIFMKHPEDDTPLLFLVAPVHLSLVYIGQWASTGGFLSAIGEPKMMNHSVHLSPKLRR